MMEQEELEMDSVTDFHVAVSDEEYSEEDVADVGLAAGSIVGSVAWSALGAIARTTNKYTSRNGLAGTARRYEYAV